MDMATGNIFDAHAGLYPSPSTDLASALPVWRDAGVTHLSINVGYDVMEPWETRATLDAYGKQIAALPGICVLAGTVDQIVVARRRGLLSISFDIEGANALGDDPAMVEVYSARGVRQMLLAYNLNNRAAGGCHDTDCGLTDFGRDVVRSMNKCGMVVDASHMGLKSSLELIDYSQTPVVFSHSNARAVHDHQRNITDEQITKCAERGGLVGINGLGLFLGDADASVARFADHVCHVADMAGPQSVALSLDWWPHLEAADPLSDKLKDFSHFWPAGNGYETATGARISPSQLPEIMETLARRGWSTAEISGFAGDNYVNLLRQVWPTG
jgi:membrane dipeptidase